MSAEEFEPETQAEEELDTREEIIAKPSFKRRLLFLGVSGMFLWFGIWFARDGFFVYPRENAEAAVALKAKGESVREEMLPHHGFDIPLQRALAFVLPPIALIMFGRAIYKSRGQYRLAGDVLSTPGHPNVPLDSIVRIDKRRFERKGIVDIEYEKGDPPVSRRLRLDDFYYERDDTDAIFDRIEAYVKARNAR